LAQWSRNDEGIMINRVISFALVCCLTFSSHPQVAPAGEEPGPAAIQVPQVAAAEGTKRALIICGHPGDKEHRQSFAETVEKTHKALVERW
jgi:hypothetical protein